MPVVRFATFNCENLFSRPWVMSLEDWADGRQVLEDVQRLSELLSQDVYTEPIKTEIAAILTAYEFDNRNLRPETRPFIVHEVREKLFSVKQDTGAIQIVADGRFDWTGWVELSREEFKGEAVLNTGRVIQLVNADVQLLVEVEDRSSLAMFNRQVLGEVLGMTPYAHNLLVDGNDPRGIDLGLLSRFPIEAVRPHFADRDTAGETIFSRDCPEFAVQLPNGETLWVLGNHFKSKGYGNWRANNRKREAQAERAAELYQAARQRSPWVIVAGDLNDLPDSDPLRPLIAGTDLCDVMTHPTYSGLPGTYETCTAKKKIDYVLLSPALWERVKAVGVERSGIYAPRTFASMPTVTSKLNAASDHASVWVDLEF